MRLSTLDRKILNAIQNDFPLEPRPFATLSRRLGIGEKDLLQRLRRFRRECLIAGLAARLNHTKMGFHSTLVGLRAPPDRIEKIARIISRYPEVTHCFLREGDHNLWAVFIYSQDRQLKQFLDRLSEVLGKHNILNLPTRRKFKLRTRLKI